MNVISKWIRAGSRLAARPSGGPEPGSEDVRTALFHCPSCETVYIAEDKDVCGGCDHPVEQVPATLTRFR
jgi:hypothetical protein